MWNVNMHFPSQLRSLRLNDTKAGSHLDDPVSNKGSASDERGSANGEAISSTLGVSRSIARIIARNGVPVFVVLVLVMVVLVVVVVPEVHGMC